MTSISPGGVFERRPWLIVLGCMIGLSVAFGPAFIATFGLYVKPLSAEFGWSRTEVSAIYSIVAIIGAMGTPVLGFALDRYGSRWAILGAALLLPAALLLLTAVPLNYVLYLGCGVVLGLVAIIASPTAYVNLLPQWFTGRLGLVVALAMTGSGLGQFVMPLAHGALLERFDWRTAWSIMAAVIAVIGLMTAIFLAHDRDSVKSLRRSGREHELDGVTIGTAMRSPTFWTAVLAFFIVMMVAGAMLTHLAPLLSDRGFSTAQAAGVVALIGMFSLGGRIATGFLLDRVGYGTIGLVVFPAQAAGCLLLASESGGIAPFAAAALIGLAYGVEADLLPYMLRTTFGLRSFGRLYGIGFGVVQVGPVFGPLILGVSFDRAGGYATGLIVLATCSLVSAALIFIASRIGRRVPVNA